MVFNFDRMHLDGHNDDYFRVTITLNKIRNVLITPAAYLFGGKTVTCYRFKIEDQTTGSGVSYRLYSDLKDSYPTPTKNLFKTLIAITCLVPSMFAYLLVCPFTLLYSDNLRLRWNAFQEYKKDPYTFSKVSSERIGVNIVHECPLFVQVKDKIRAAIWHQDPSMLGRAFDLLGSIELDNLEHHLNFSKYYKSLPIEERAAPIRGELPYAWYSLSDIALNPLREHRIILRALDFHSHSLEDILQPYQVPEA